MVIITNSKRTCSGFIREFPKGQHQIITAASCVHGAHIVNIHFGALEIGKGKIIQVRRKQIEIHEKFELYHNSGGFNIAKIQLNEPIPSNIDFGTIDIVNENFEFNLPYSHSVTVYGYGLDIARDGKLTGLKHMNMIYMTGEQCYHFYHDSYFNHTRSVCFAEQISSNEDFGGPVVLTLTKKVAAIITYVLTGRADVITPLAQHRAFLDQIKSEENITPK